jgi:hypothetical protein
LGALSFSSAPDLLVEANRIQGNVAAFGAGLALESCLAARVLNNLILDNLAYDYSGASGMGGGIHCTVNINSGQTAIANNTIVGNSAPVLFGAESGGGLALTLLTNNLVLANNIIASNSSGIWRDWRTTNQPVLLNNCLMNPTNYLYLSAGPTDIQADPKFVSRATGDFHLQATSPCIDAGTSANAPATDKDSVARPLDGNADGIATFDIGAYEFVHPTADTDHDGLADAAELIAGTNPTDPASWLRLDVSLLALENSVALRWLSVTGRTYAIHWKAAPGQVGAWQELMNSIPGCGDIMECREPYAGVSRRFYRLSVAK